MPPRSRAWAIQRTAARLNFVDHVERTNGVEVPNDFAVGDGVTTKMTVDRTGECNSGNCTDSGGLRRTAALAVTTIGGRCVPDAFAIIESKREHAAAGFGIRFGSLAVGNRRAHDIG